MWSEVTRVEGEEESDRRKEELFVAWSICFHKLETNVVSLFILLLHIPGPDHRENGERTRLSGRSSFSALARTSPISFWRQPIRDQLGSGKGSLSPGPLPCQGLERRRHRAHGHLSRRLAILVSVRKNRGDRGQPELVPPLLEALADAPGDILRVIVKLFVGEGRHFGVGQPKENEKREERKGGVPRRDGEMCPGVWNETNASL